KLVVDSGGEGHHVDSASGFWGAMKTIMIADALMGMDNVLGVAGAAQGSFILVTLGLATSIPIVIWGSQIILKWVERVPVIVYIGSGVLAWTAAAMMVGEPLLKDTVKEYPVITGSVYFLITAAVLCAGFRVNHAKVRARVSAHLADVAVASADGSR